MTCKQCGLEKKPQYPSGWTQSGWRREVAGIIKRQIGIPTLMEVGAHGFKVMNPGGSRGGLAFSIKYKSNRRGYVTVVLHPGRDTYEIEMKDFRRKTIVSRDNIYASQLKTVLRSGFKKLRGER